jgi:hypothetical protein
MAKLQVRFCQQSCTNKVSKKIDTVTLDMFIDLSLTVVETAESYQVRVFLQAPGYVKGWASRQCPAWFCHRS